jgi:hypothetical protein
MTSSDSTPGAAARQSRCPGTSGCRSRLPDPDRGGPERPPIGRRGATSTPSLRRAPRHEWGGRRRHGRFDRLALGQGAAYLGRIDDAVRHLRGLAANEAAGLRTYVARRVAASAPSWSSSGRPTTSVKKVGARWSAALEVAGRPGICQPLATRGADLIDGLTTRDRVAVLSASGARDRIARGEVLTNGPDRRGSTSRPSDRRELHVLHPHEARSGTGARSRRGGRPTRAGPRLDGCTANRRFADRGPSEHPHSPAPSDREHA